MVTFAQVAIGSNGVTRSIVIGWSKGQSYRISFTNGVDMSNNNSRLAVGTITPCTNVRMTVSSGSLYTGYFTSSRTNSSTHALHAEYTGGSANGGTINYAGMFAGNVTITGTLSKGGGTFMIDHPLDPDYKYLYHSFVESPDMKNI